MHVQTKCFNLICHLDSNLQWKKQKTPKSSLQTRIDELQKFSFDEFLNPQFEIGTLKQFMQFCFHNTTSMLPI
jgi:hypothetical protein